MHWLLIALIGFAIGAFVGLISGIMIADDRWHKKFRYYYDELDRYSSNNGYDANLLYELEPKQNKKEF